MPLMRRRSRYRLRQSRMKSNRLRRRKTPLTRGYSAGDGRAGQKMEVTAM